MQRRARWQQLCTVLFLFLWPAGNGNGKWSEDRSVGGCGPFPNSRAETRDAGWSPSVR